MLSVRFSKDELTDKLNSNDTIFRDALKLAKSDDPNLGWRAAWVLYHSIERNDERIKRNILQVIKSINGKRDGHQRELLKIISKMDINENQEGYLFDSCLTIWENINKSPSVRITAFRTLMNLVKKYPELLEELEAFTDIHYVECLSPGIKRSFQKLVKEIKKPSQL